LFTKPSEMTKIQQKAGWLMTIIFGLTIIFHLLVLIGVIPYNIVWGGRLNSQADMIQFETISLIVNFIFLFVILIKMRWIKAGIPAKFLNGIIWIMCGLFLFNTLGNLLSIDYWERVIFTPVTLILSICAFLIVRKSSQEDFS
jgi:hypothetical protein